MFLSSVLLLQVSFCTPTHNHECDLNNEGDEGANVILCYNFCDRDCSSILGCEISRKWQTTWIFCLYASLPLHSHLLYLSNPRIITPGYRTHTPISNWYQFTVMISTIIIFLIIIITVIIILDIIIIIIIRVYKLRVSVRNAPYNFGNALPLSFDVSCVRGLVRRGSVVVISSLPLPTYLCEIVVTKHPARNSELMWIKLNWTAYEQFLKNQT